MKISAEIPQNLKMEIPLDPASSILSIFPKELKHHATVVYALPMFRAEQFIITVSWKQPPILSTDEWVEKNV